MAEALLSGREVLRLSADSADFSLPSAEADWQILLLDDLQDMQGGAGLERPVRADSRLPPSAASSCSPAARRRGVSMAFQYPG